MAQKSQKKKFLPGLKFEDAIVQDRIGAFLENDIHLVSDEEERNNRPHAQWKFRCTVCICIIPGIQGAQSHMEGHRHNQNVIFSKTGVGQFIEGKYKGKNVKRKDSPGHPGGKEEVWDDEICEELGLNAYDNNDEENKYNPVNPTTQEDLPTVPIPKQTQVPKSAFPYLTMQEKLTSLVEPIVGLESVVEHHVESGEMAPFYECQLCNSNMADANLINHLKGRTHRMNFIQQKDVTKFASISTLPPYNIGKAMLDTIKNMEEEFGRGFMPIVIDKDVSKHPDSKNYQVLREKRKESEKVIPEKRMLTNTENNKERKKKRGKIEFKFGSSISKGPVSNLPSYNQMPLNNFNNSNLNFGNVQGSMAEQTNYYPNQYPPYGPAGMFNPLGNTQTGLIPPINPDLCPISNGTNIQPQPSLSPPILGVAPDAPLLGIAPAQNNQPILGTAPNLANQINQPLLNQPMCNTNPMMGPGNMSPMMGQGNMNPMMGQSNINPMMGAGNMTPMMGPGNMNPMMGLGNMNPMMGQGNMSSMMGPGNMSPMMGPGNMNPMMGPGNMNLMMGQGNMNPMMGQGNVNSMMGQGNMNSMMGQGNVNPMMGQGNMNPMMGQGNVNPMMGQGNVNTMMGQSTNQIGEHGGMNPLMGQGNVNPMMGQGNMNFNMGQGNVNSNMVQGDMNHNMRPGNTNVIMGQRNTSIGNTFGGPVNHFENHENGNSNMGVLPTSKIVHAPLNMLQGSADINSSPYKNSTDSKVNINLNSYNQTPNSNMGQGSFNSNIAQLPFNSNMGQGSFNSNTGQGTFNSNMGQGTFNSNTGQVSFNSNTGQGAFNSNMSVDNTNSNMARQTLNYNNMNQEMVHSNANQTSSTSGLASSTMNHSSLISGSGAVISNQLTESSPLLSIGSNHLISAMASTLKSVNVPLLAMEALLETPKTKESLLGAHPTNSPQNRSEISQKTLLETPNNIHYDFKSSKEENIPLLGNDGQLNQAESSLSKKVDEIRNQRGILLEALESWEIKSEQEASAALKVINRLNQSLSQYKLKRNPPST